MGAGIAATMRRAGYTVHVCDAQVAAACERLVSVVVNAQQTEAVLFGEGGAAAALRPGSVFVMCSTVDPNWSVALEARLAVACIHYIDAPISGGAGKAASGQMTMMTSARPEAYAKAGDLLESMAGKVYRLGDRAGAGSKVKLLPSPDSALTVPTRSGFLSLGNLSPGSGFLSSGLAGIVEP